LSGVAHSYEVCAPGKTLVRRGFALSSIHYAGIVQGHASANQVRWEPFLTANAAGALLWSAVFSYGAFLIGKGAENTGHSVEIGLGLLALIFLIAAGFYLRRNEHRLQEAAEAALPGPLPA
jgi:hypothetical protein